MALHETFAALRASWLDCAGGMLTEAEGSSATEAPPETRPYTHPCRGAGQQAGYAVAVAAGNDALLEEGLHKALNEMPGRSPLSCSTCRKLHRCGNIKSRPMKGRSESS